MLVVPGSAVKVEAKAMIVLGEHTAPESDADHSVAASLAAAVTSITEDMPAHAPRPEVLK